MFFGVECQIGRNIFSIRFMLLALSGLFFFMLTILVSLVHHSLPSHLVGTETTIIVQSER